MTGPDLTPDECVAAIVRAYGRERREGVPAVRAITNVAERLGVQADSVTRVIARDKADRLPRSAAVPDLDPPAPPAREGGVW
jgi:hypothetical protein